jgi:pimeloyl-ACP methyl ester carboxylesterase
MTIIQTKTFQLAANIKGDNKAAKLALILPGRLDTKDYAHMTSLVDFFASRGYLAISFDPPGTWDSSGEIDIYSTTNYLKAIDELIEYFGNRPTVLAGHSRGGTVAIHAGASNPAVVGFIAMMPSYGAATPPSTEAMAAGVQIELRDIPPGTTRTTEQRKFLLPMAYFEDAVQYDSVPILGQCTKPKLLFYGDHDKFTEPDDVKSIFAKIPEPKILKGLKTEHDYRLRPEVMAEVNDTIAEFLEKHKM